MKTLRHQFFSSYIFTVLCVMLCGIPHLLQAGARNVTRDISYGDDLQLAIDEAESEDKLELEGTFVGNFTIDKSLTLTGPKDDTLANPIGGEPRKVDLLSWMEISKVLC